MVNWYMKGQSDYISANFHMGFYIDHDGFDKDDYDTQDMETHGATSDPFMAFGIDTGPVSWTYGQQQVEIGLLKSHRLKFDTTGSYKWVGPGQDDWAIIEAAGSAGNLGDLDDVVITGTPANNELLAWDTTTSKWINQTAAESGLSVSGHTHAQLHDRSHTYDSASDHSGTLSWAKVNKTGSNLTDLATRQHAGLTDITSDQHHAQSHDNTYHSTNYHTEVAGTGVVTVHSDMTSAGSGAIITVGERSNLHTIYSLEQHNNDYHSTNYHTEVAGTGVVTVHSDVTSAGSGAIITTGERNALHPIVTSVYNLKALDDRDYKPNTSDSYGFVKTFFTSLGGMTGVADSDYQDLLILNTYTDASGGDINALTFDKSTQLIKHWLADQAAATWGTPKTIAYTDALHSEVHVLATTGPHTGTLPWTDLNKTGSSLADLITRTHANLSDAPADAHHVSFLQADADALYSVLAHLHDGDTLQNDGITSSAVGGFVMNATGFYAILSGGAITLKPSSDLDNYIRFATTSNVPEMDFLGGVNGKIMHVVDPTNAQDVATKKYHDDNLYTLESHDNTYHTTNYHTEAAGTGVVTIHSDMTSAGSGAIITVGERGNLHSDVVTTNAHVQALSINAVSEDSSPSLGGNLTLAGGYRIIGPGVSDYYIWSISSAYLTYGLYYNTGTPDYLEIKWAGATTFAVDMETGNITTVGTVDGVDVGDLKTAFDALDYYTQAEVNGLLHPQAHTLASHTTKAHSELSDAPTSAHHVKTVKYTAGEVDARIVVQNTDPDGTIDIAIDALIATHVTAGHTLNQINNPSGDKEFNFANKHLHFKWVAPASGAHEGAFEIEASGAFSGDLMHIHQHTGVVGANTYMVFIECEHANASCLHLEHGANIFDFGANGLLIGADARITEFDTGTLDASDTKVPTSGTVKEAIDLLKEQSAAFPVSPSEGDFHYDEDDDSLYRYNGEAEAWIEVGGIGLISGENDVNKAYVDEIKWGYIINATERSTASTGYVKIKEITVLSDIHNVFVSYEHRTTNASFHADTKIYVNGSPVGVEHAMWSETYAKVREEVFNLSADDLVQVYGHGSGSHSCYVKNFVIGDIGTINASY